MDRDFRLSDIRTILIMLWVMAAIILVLPILLDVEGLGYLDMEVPVLGVSFSMVVFVILTLPWVLPLFRPRQASKEELGGNFCVNCGNALNPDTNFCGKCGTRRD